MKAPQNMVIKPWSEDNPESLEVTYLPETDEWWIEVDDFGGSIDSPFQSASVKLDKEQARLLLSALRCNGVGQ